MNETVTHAYTYMYFYKTEMTKREERKKRKPSPGGLEPPTFRLTAERANRLRHGDLDERQTHQPQSQTYSAGVLTTDTKFLRNYVF